MKNLSLASIDNVSLRAVIADGAIRQRGPKPPGKLQAWLELRRERREITAIGARGRLELHAMLLARGEAGLSERVWSPARRVADILACDASDHVRAVALTHSTVILRSVSR